MRRPLGALLLLGMVVAACGDDGTSAPSESATPSAATSDPVEPTTVDSTASSIPDTSEPDTTEPDTTDAPDTTAPSTTATPTTIAPATGWVVSDFVPGAAVQGYSGNWAGDAGPSPAAPAAGDTPADGFYSATVLEPWNPDQPDELSVRIERLELCTVLPEGCEYMEPDEMNVDPAWQLDLDVPLDATTAVVVDGFSCWDVPELKQGTGTELADLFAAYSADYQSAIAPQLTGDPSDQDIVFAVAAAPTGGFVGEETICPGGMAGPLRYVHDDAPVLLLQTVTDWDGGPLDATDLVRMSGVQYTDGTPLYYFYAGFMS